MRDAEAAKIERWADTGDRLDPEDAGIDRGRGWTVGYEQPSSGLAPERTVWNQIVREITGLYADAADGRLEWDPEVDYARHAFATRHGILHVASEPTGPATGNAADPADGRPWRLY